MLLRDIGREEYQVFERVLDSFESQMTAAESAELDTNAPAAADCGA